MLRFRLQPILCRIVILECSVGKGAPWGMVLGANPSQRHVITSLFPPPEDQRLLRVPEWGTLSVKMLHWFCQASICQRANSIIIRQSRGPCKGGKTKDARPIMDCGLHKKVVGTQESCGEQVVLPFRIRVHPFTKINQWAVRWFQGLLTLIWASDSLTFPSMPFFCLEHVPTNLKQRSFRLSTQSLNSA